MSLNLTNGVFPFLGLVSITMNNCELIVPVVDMVRICYSSSMETFDKDSRDASRDDAGRATDAPDPRNAFPQRELTQTERFEMQLPRRLELAAILHRLQRLPSIDELPQLINVLKGEMSIVGFRPPLTYHPWPIEEYTPYQKRMFLVKPGITGWAQVNGRKDVEWHDRIRLNVYYVDNISLWLDIKIIFLTVINVLKNKDNVNTKATVEFEAAEDETIKN